MLLNIKSNSVFSLLFLFSLPSFAAIQNKKNGEHVTLSGKVTKATAHTFTVDTGKKEVLVEMDDFGWAADGYKIAKGDEVMVTGKVDKDFLEKKKVEAGNVYVKNLKTYFFANSTDEEDYPNTTSYMYLSTLPHGAFIDMTGKVTNKSGREFTVDTGVRKVVVDTDQMLYNPLDKTGYTKVDVGDRVRVSGRVDDDLFEAKEIKASSIYEYKN